MQELVNHNTEVSSELRGVYSNSLPLREKKAKEYVVNSFNGKMSSLIPFALQNESILKLASYLLKYTTGSKYTLYQYVRSILDSSPLIRNEHKTTVEAISPSTVHYVVQGLYRRAGLIERCGRARYDFRAHSIHKYFRTQLGATSTIPTDYIEYMMGDTISTYNDVRMKGVEFLRSLYASSGLSIRPKTRLSKVEQLKIFVESLGLNPNEVLSKDALVTPHHTVVDPEQRKIEVLNQALKQAIIKELNQGIPQHV